MSVGTTSCSNHPVPASTSYFDSGLQAARNGSREAQACLLEKVRPYLLALAEDVVASDVRPKLAASDVVQNTVYQAWQDFGDFRGQTRAELVSWLKTILLHCATDNIQVYRGTLKRDLSREVSLEQIGSNMDDVLADSLSSPSEHLKADEQKQRMDQVVRRLSSRYEQAIRLRNDLGLSFSEMGVALGCSDNAARKLWLRAVKELGRELRRHDFPID